MEKSYYHNMMFIIFLSLILSSNNGYSQITITSNEWPNNFGFGWVDYVVEDTVGTGIPINLGSTGGPQTWTFTPAMFPGGYDQTVTIVDPATTPYASVFPTSDHAWHLVSSGGGSTMDLYSFLDLKTNGLFIQGLGVFISPFNFALDYTPDDLVLQFPASLNSSWTSNFSYSFEPSPGIIQFDSVSRNSTIDAWGTINLPTGNFDCLRVRGEQIEIEMTYISGILFNSDTISRFTYSWGTENQGLLAEVYSLDDETNPNFNFAEGITFQTIPTRLEGQKDHLLTYYQLHQNYPNPFNPSTIIEFVLPRTGFVILKIYDVLGKEIITLVSEKLAAGKHKYIWNAGNLTNGVYYYRLEAGEFAGTKKMLLLK